MSLKTLLEYLRYKLEMKKLGKVPLRREFFLVRADGIASSRMTWTRKGR